MEEGVYLLEVKIDHARIFKKHSCLQLKNEESRWEQWTIILGDNSTGKTTLLQLVAALEQKEIFHEEQRKFQSLNYSFVTNPSGGFASFEVGELLIQAKTTLSIAETDYDINFSTGKRTSKLVNPTNTNPKYTKLKIYGYGANRITGSQPISRYHQLVTNSLFREDSELINAEEWLLQLDYAASKTSDIQELAKKRRDLVKVILTELLPEIESIRFTEPTKLNFIPQVEFKTQYGKWVTIHQLSLGYKTMVAWMVDLAARLFERYPDSDNPLAEPAIVLVDEIDLHMHPKWQRKIFDYLSEKFPKTQFIVTAHSPLIVQSAPKDANIVLLRREGDHVVIDNDIQSVHNWRIDQILNSDLFGNISERSADTEAWREERVELIQKGNRTEAEQQRLEELNKKAHELPTADNQQDIEAMQIIREAAEYLKSNKSGTPA